MHRFRISSIIGSTLVFAVIFTVFSCTVWAQDSDSPSKKDAEILYDEAIELKRNGDLTNAIETYVKAMRLDRSILANDDYGLVDALKKYYEEKIVKNPDNVKDLETMGFIYAVCFSDYTAAIKSYEKVMDLSSDETVKERIKTLIERLKQSDEVEQEYQTEVSTQLRDERLQSWTEMERMDRMTSEATRIHDMSSELKEAYSTKEELSNRVPQLEKELEELQEAYNKANSLYYGLSDNGLYERRRRRLEDDIAEKNKELTAARSSLEAAERTSERLDRQLSIEEQKKNANPVRSYDEYNNSASDDSSDNDPSSSYDESEDKSNNEALTDLIDDL